MLQNVLLLLLDRGDKSTDTAKVISPILGAKTPRDLLLDFDHALVSFHKVVIKGNLKVLHKPQGPRLVLD